MKAFFVMVLMALIPACNKGDESRAQMEEYKKILRDLEDGKKKRETEKAVEKTQAFMNSLDNEEKHYERIETRRLRQIELDAKIQALKEAADSAEREAKIAEIESRRDH